MPAMYENGRMAELEEKHWTMDEGSRFLTRPSGSTLYPKRCGDFAVRHKPSSPGHPLASRSYRANCSSVDSRSITRVGSSGPIVWVFPGSSQPVTGDAPAPERTDNRQTISCHTWGSSSASLLAATSAGLATATADATAVAAREKAAVAARAKAATARRPNSIADAASSTAEERRTVAGGSHDLASVRAHYAATQAAAHREAARPLAALTHMRRAPSADVGGFSQLPRRGTGRGLDAGHAEPRF